MSTLAVLPRDPRLLVPLLCTVMMGAVMVPSAGVILGDGLWFKHLAYLAVASLAFAVFLFLPSRVLQLTHPLALGIALMLCALVLVPGLGREINGARRWLDLGLVTVQSGELAKLLMLVYTAGFLARFGDQVGSLRLELFAPLTALLAIAILLLAAPDFGTVVVIALVLMGLMFVAGVPLRLFLMLAALAVLLGGIVAVWQPYRLARLTAFVDPWGDAFGNGYQLVQSLIAFGRGGLFGVGLGEGVQKLHYLPEAHNDFIFAVLIEELGLVGGLLLMAAFCALVLRLLELGRQCVRQDFWFGGYVLYGAALLLGGQCLINIGVASGTLPTKGLTLPLVSYGGNALLVTGALLGMVCRVQFELEHERLAPRQRRAAHRADSRARARDLATQNGAAKAKRTSRSGRAAGRNHRG
ncbi:MAG: putative peptidoglycan glycosyltransferase FtsW [Pseudomonadota bacterium]